MYPKIAFFAMKDIKVGDELTFNYNPDETRKRKVTTQEPTNDPWAGSYRVGIDARSTLEAHAH
jgi:SET domain-containing protein